MEIKTVDRSFDIGMIDSNTIMLDVRHTGQYAPGKSIASNLTVAQTLKLVNTLLGMLKIGQIEPNIVEVVTTHQEGYKLV